LRDRRITIRLDPQLIAGLERVKTKDESVRDYIERIIKIEIDNRWEYFQSFPNDDFIPANEFID